MTNPELIASVGDVRLATIFHPNTDPKVIRSFETKRGIDSRISWKSKKERKEKLAHRAQNYKSEGKSNRWIGKRLGVAESTIRSWLKESK